MAAPIVRADYDQLKGIFGRFGSQADAIRQTLRSLQKTTDALQGGDWVGQGADSFYREMNSEVFPAMERLLSALDAAGRTTKGIVQIMKDLEGEVVRLFAAILAGLAAGPAGASGPGEAATPQEAFLHARRSPRPGRGRGRGDSGPRRRRPPPRKSTDPEVDRIVAEVDRMKAQLDPKLRAHMDRWDVEGSVLWDQLLTIGANYHGYEVQGQTVEDQLRDIAGAYADSRYPPIDAQGLDKIEYAGQSANRAINVEAARTFAEVTLAGEMRTSGIDFAPRLPAGANPKDFADINDSHVRDLALARIEPVTETLNKNFATNRAIYEVGDLLYGGEAGRMRQYSRNWDEAAKHWETLNNP